MSNKPFIEDFQETSIIGGSEQFHEGKETIDQLIPVTGGEKKKEAEEKTTVQAEIENPIKKNSTNKKLVMRGVDKDASVTTIIGKKLEEGFAAEVLKENMDKKEQPK
ncbi:hypothetical protein ACFL15_01440 [Patescibacteria group bacterium]